MLGNIVAHRKGSIRSIIQLTHFIEDESVFGGVLIQGRGWKFDTTQALLRQVAASGSHLVMHQSFCVPAHWWEKRSGGRDCFERQWQSAGSSVSFSVLFAPPLSPAILKPHLKPGFISEKSNEFEINCSDLIVDFH